MAVCVRSEIAWSLVFEGLLDSRQERVVGLYRVIDHLVYVPHLPLGH
jgi:hypothetical protein